MDKYCDVDKLTWQVQDSDKYGTITKQVFISLLQNSETADVAPVVHAYWKDRRDNVFDCLDWGICSHCENLLPALAYCGFCGAKMDEEVHHV